MTSLDRVLTRLPAAKRVGQGWKATCPLHEGTRRNLYVAQTRGGRILIQCMTGCRWQEAARCIGLEPRDLKGGRS